MIGSLYFAVCAIVALAGALGVVLSKSPIRSAVALLATILGFAGLFLRLNAQFLAAIQVIVYSGAVVVLFVFVIMLLGSGADAERGGRARVVRVVGGVLTGLLSAAAVWALAPQKPIVLLATPSPQYGSVELVGRQLFSTALVPFELSTALLVVAVIAAISVARGGARRRTAPAEPNPTRRLFHGPVHPRDAVTAKTKEPSP